MNLHEKIGEKEIVESWRAKAVEKWRGMTWQGRQGWLLKILPTDRYGEIYEHAQSPYLGDLKEEDIKILAKEWGLLP